MSTYEKWKALVDWQVAHGPHDYNALNGAAKASEIAKIEKLVSEKLPEALTQILLQHDGENGEGAGLFFGSQLVSTSEILSTVKLGISMQPRKRKPLSNPEKSAELIKQILAFYEKRIAGRSWYKLELDCGPGSFGGPYLYETAQTTDEEREIVKIHWEDYDELHEIVQELHDLEKKDWKWDKLEFVIYPDIYKVERTKYNFDSELELTSTPPDAIQKKYFHPKWIPVFSDSGGNYIGIDLDPDILGKKGQVIVFGRDEENMFVIADDLESFLDLCQRELEIHGVESKLMEDGHLHEALRNYKL